MSEVALLKFGLRVEQIPWAELDADQCVEQRQQRHSIFSMTQMPCRRTTADKDDIIDDG